MSSLNIVLIVAAGAGTRMKTKVKKQFLDLLGQPILVRTIKRFEKMDSVDYIYLVLSEEDISFFKNELLPKYFSSSKKLKTLIKGGKERFFSVYNGLKVINSHFEHNHSTIKVLIHDGVRPFVNEQIVKKLLEVIGEKKGGVVGIPVKDTIRIVDKNEYLEEYLERSKLRALQTPQGFLLKEIYQAYKEAVKNNFIPTDDTAVFMAQGYKVKVIEGSHYNIKITTPEDLIFAEAILQLERDFYNVY